MISNLRSSPQCAAPGRPALGATQPVTAGQGAIPTSLVPAVLARKHRRAAPHPVSQRLSRVSSEPARMTKMPGMQPEGWQASDVAESSSTVQELSQIRIVAAAVLGLLFACAFIAVAVVISVDAVTNHGPIGTAARNTVGGRGSPATGVWTVAVVLTLGGLWLIRSAVRALRRQSYLGIVLPLGFLLVVGTAGEIVDLLGTASGISDLVGALILVLATVPIVLLWPYRRQPSAEAKPGERSFLGGFIKVSTRSQ